MRIHAIRSLTMLQQRRKSKSRGTPFRPLYGADFSRFIATELEHRWPVMRAFNQSQK